MLPRPKPNPAEVYLSSLSAGSQGMSQCLHVMAQLLDPTAEAMTLAWETLDYRDSLTIRTGLAERYRPLTVNKMLSALRGVLKAAWRLGLMSADAYQRAADIRNLPASTLPSGRALGVDEIARLFKVCAEDDSPKGVRDAAILTVFYACGLRRNEVARLDLEHLDLDESALHIEGKRNKQRVVYLTETGRERLDTWLNLRGDHPGPLFSPISQTGEIRPTRLSGESLAYILQTRQRQAKLDPFSPHDLRRTFVTLLLDAGEDVFTVQRLAGHADVSTTARYDRRGEGAKRQAVERIAIPGRVA